MSSFWGWYIAFIVILNIVGCGLLLFFTRRNPLEGKQPHETTGHVFDGIEELNNPLPRWWIFSFWLTIIFSVGYLLLYPGLGIYNGSLGWSSTQQLQQDQQQAQVKYAPLFAKYGGMPIEALAKDADAMAMGERLFANNCATCHGSDAKGARGFPNLTDADWIHGGAPETIEQTIMHGRNGVMPPLGRSLGHDQVQALVAHVISLSGRKHDPQLASQGKAIYAQVCIACHGPDGKGNQALGAPNLTDNVWLYGGSAKAIRETIVEGRNGHMPAHKDLLGKDKIHILAAYVYSLSHRD